MQVAAYGSVRKWTLAMNIGKHSDSNRESQLLSQDQCSNYVFTCFIIIIIIIIENEEMIVAVNAIYAIALRSLKNSGLQRDLNPWPRDTGAML